MRRIIVIGASGYLGTAITALDSRLCSVTATYRTALCPVHNSNTVHIYLYFGNRSSVLGMQRMIETMDQAAVTVIIASNVEYGTPDDKTLGNYHELLSVLRRKGVKTIFLSTDAVFDGRRGAYAEDGISHPITPYGKQKLIAEGIIGGGQNLIIRTSYLYGSNGYINDKRWREIRQAAEIGRPLYKATNLIRNPIYVLDLAQAILAVAKESGVLHIGGPAMSAYEFYCNLAREAGIRAQVMEEVSGKELIPLNTSLISSRLAGLGIRIPSMAENTGRIYPLPGASADKQGQFPV